MTEFIKYLHYSPLAALLSYAPFLPQTPSPADTYSLRLLLPLAFIIVSIGPIISSSRVASTVVFCKALQWIINAHCMILEGRLLQKGPLWQGWPQTKSLSSLVSGCHMGSLYTQLGGGGLTGDLIDGMPASYKLGIFWVLSVILLTFCCLNINLKCCKCSRKFKMHAVFSCIGLSQLAYWTETKQSPD